MPWKTRSFTITAEIGRKEEESALAQTMMSGSMPMVWLPQ